MHTLPLSIDLTCRIISATFAGGGNSSLGEEAGCSSQYTTAVAHIVLRSLQCFKSPFHWLRYPQELTDKYGCSSSGTPGYTTDSELVSLVWCRNRSLQYWWQKVEASSASINYPGFYWQLLFFISREAFPRHKICISLLHAFYTQCLRDNPQCTVVYEAINGCWD